MGSRTSMIYLYLEFLWLFSQHDGYNLLDHLVDQIGQSIDGWNINPLAATSVHTNIPCLALQNSKKCLYAFVAFVYHVNPTLVSQYSSIIHCKIWHYYKMTKTQWFFLTFRFKNENNSKISCRNHKQHTLVLTHQPLKHLFRAQHLCIMGQVLMKF